MSHYKNRKEARVIPTATKVLGASATLTDTDSYVLVNGPASSGGGSPGFTTQTDSVDWDTTLGSFGAEAEYSSSQIMGVYPDFTLAVWLKPTGAALTNRCWIFQNFRLGNSTDDIIMEARGDVSGDPFSMYVGSGGAFADKEYQFGQMVLDTWTYIVATWDDSAQELKVYQDGVEQVPSAKPQDDTISPALTDTGNKRVNVGNSGGNWRPRMIALSAAMWSNPLTSAEVAATYNGDGGGSFDLEFNQAAYTSAGTLEHWWRFGHQGVPNMFVDYADDGTNPQTLDQTNIGAAQIQAFDAPPGGSAILVTLPDAATNSGREVTIQDQAGNAAGVAIVVLPGGSDSIEGNASDEINTALGAKTYTSDGAGIWRVQNTNTLSGAGETGAAGTTGEVGPTGQAAVEFSGALIRKNANQTLTTAIDTVIDWQTEIYDSGGWFDSGTDDTYFEVPAGVTRVRISANVVFATNTAGQRIVSFEKDTAPGYSGFTSFSGRGIYVDDALSGSIVPIAGQTTLATQTAVIDVSPGDRFRARATQDSGGNLDLEDSTAFWFMIEAVDGVVGFTGGTGGTGETGPTGLQGPGAAEYAKFDTTHSPIALYQFEDDFTDSSGNARNLTLSTGVERYTTVEGLRALYLDGADRYSSTDAAFRVTGDLTIEALIVSYKPMDDTVNDILVSQDGGTGDGDDTLNFLYRHTISSVRAQNYFAEEAGGANISFSQNDASVPMGTLTHIVMVRASNVITFYIDGVQAGASSGTLNAPVDGSASTFNVGNSLDDPAGTYFQGALASLKIVGSALTAQQVLDEYELTLGNRVATVGPTGETGPIGETGPGAADFSGAMVAKNATQSITHNTAPSLTWQTETYDVGNWFASSGDTFFTVPAGVTHVKLTAGCVIQANATGRRDLAFVKDTGGGFTTMAGRGYQRQQAITDGVNADVIQVTSPVYAVNAGDKFETLVFQDSGISLTANDSDLTYFAIESVLGIKGDFGETGPTGETGVTGTTGPGVADFSGALVSKDISADQTLTTGVNTDVIFDTEVYDVGGWYADGGDETIFTVPAGITRVRLAANVRMSTPVSTGERRIRILKDGVNVEGTGTLVTPGTGGAVSPQLFVGTGVVEVTAGDTFTVSAWQNSGGNLDVVAAPGNTWFSIEAVPGGVKGNTGATGETGLPGAAVLSVAATGTTATMTTEDAMLVTTGGVTITLPSAATVGSGVVIYVKDRDGSAGASAITVDGAGSETIDGNLTFSISSNYQSVTLLSDGTNWSIL